MNCDKVKEYLVEYWSGTLEGKDSAAVQAHLRDCAACQLESEHLSHIWESLGHFPEPKPSPDLRSRFSETLAAYQLGMSAASKKKAAPWWQLRPAFQVGAVAATLLVGLVAGHLLTATRQSAQEVVSLRQELAGMRHMITLSLLQQQNATDRLRGVAYGERATAQDTDVLAALLYTLTHDASVNVRLSAADALRGFTDSPVVRKTLPDSLARQESPLVQVALIDLMADVKGRDIDEALRLAAANNHLMQPVRDRARRVLRTRQGDMQ